MGYGSTVGVWMQKPGSQEISLVHGADLGPLMVHSTCKPTGFEGNSSFPFIMDDHWLPCGMTLHWPSLRMGSSQPTKDNWHQGDNRGVGWWPETISMSRDPKQHSFSWMDIPLSINKNVLSELDKWISVESESLEVIGNKNNSGRQYFSLLHWFRLESMESAGIQEFWWNGQDSSCISIYSLYIQQKFYTTKNR